MALAERQILLGIANLLWAFNIETIPGDPIDLQEYDGVAGRSPVPFRVRMVPRDANVARVLGI
ncbi:hypothetical protein TRAPUB_10196 [Trametes pubescens]|uniref:Uncharacterized protein n=1 Tax=Trametes pubescens TaxID=154538 RepID=A0A1M2W077_TRAPU|nr:hypothetical protein TRAPUB_10196 [Trametes pubescens]